MRIATEMSDEIARYIDLASDQAKLTAANMANVDTPGYQTVGMNFGAEMQQAIDDVDRGRKSHKVHLFDVDGLVARPDGNNVSIDREGLDLAEAQLRYNTGVSLLHTEYQREMDAIHAS